MYDKRESQQFDDAIKRQVMAAPSTESIKTFSKTLVKKAKYCTLIPTDYLFRDVSQFERIMVSAISHPNLNGVPYLRYLTVVLVDGVSRDTSPQFERNISCAARLTSKPHHCSEVYQSNGNAIRKTPDCICD